VLKCIQRRLSVLQKATPTAKYTSTKLKSDFPIPQFLKRWLFCKEAFFFSRLLALLTKALKNEARG